MSATGEAETVPCQSFEDFVAKVRKERFVFDRIFRGQRDITWPLQSMFERWLSKRVMGEGPHNFDQGLGGREGRLKFTKAGLEHFRQLITGMPGISDTVLHNDNYLWALGRHYGLVTPLLDWSESPFVAAFFAFFGLLMYLYPHYRQMGALGEPDILCATPQPPPIAIWELYYGDKDLIVEGEFEVFISRYGSSARQKAQAGVFTALTHQSFTDIASYLAGRNKLYLLRKYVIPGTKYRAALGSLRQMNIRYDTLFPDPEGAAMEANLAPVFSTYGLIDD